MGLSNIHDDSMAKDKSRDTTQFAALLWRISERGTREVMLLTSRETYRW